MKTYITNSRQETIRLAEKLSKGFKKGAVVALVGELGSGKTTFVKGIAKRLGIRNSQYVNSPSFVIIREHKGKLPLYHFDVYRLGDTKDLEDLGYEEYFYGDGVCVIEWADKIRRLLPAGRIKIKFEILGENKRRITLYESFGN